MRAVGRANGVSAKAYAGTSGVLLAFDVVPERREGLLGFANDRGLRDWHGAVKKHLGIDTPSAVTRDRLAK